MMKYILIFLISTPLWAQTEVSCQSNDGKWKITLTIDGNEAKDVQFLKNNELVKSFTMVGVKTLNLRFPRRMVIYELVLGRYTYLDIERLIKKKVPASTGTGEFLIVNHPLAPEVLINCTFH
jgi:hypothetical protein